jgi:hypothetical protein
LRSPQEKILVGLSFLRWKYVEYNNDDYDDDDDDDDDDDVMMTMMMTTMMEGKEDRI